MRVVRVRFTLGRLMGAVLVAGLALGGAVFLRPILDQLAIERRAEASYEKAKRAREVAEVAIEQYKGGPYLQDLATYRGQIALAQANRSRAIDRLDRTKVADRLALQQADFDLEQAQSQLEVLKEYTKQKQMRTLGSNLEKARASEQSQRETYRTERTRRRQMLGFGKP